MFFFVITGVRKIKLLKSMDILIRKLKTDTLRQSLTQLTKID